MSFKALDVFSGLGGWSDGLAMEGFEVLGIEIEPKIVKLYKHECITADVTKIDGLLFRGFDLIVGSPPCRDFTKMCDYRWKIPKDPNRGLKLVNTFLRIIEEASPKYWLMENVKGLMNHIELKPRCNAKLSKTMIRYFWGTFPSFLIPYDLNRRITTNIHGPLRKWERSRIPLPISRALGRAVYNALTRGGIPFE